MNTREASQPIEFDINVGPPPPVLLQLGLWIAWPLLAMGCSPYAKSGGRELHRRRVARLGEPAIAARIGMIRTPADEFDHPALAEGHPLRRHVL